MAAVKRLGSTGTAYGFNPGRELLQLTKLIRERWSFGSHPRLEYIAAVEHSEDTLRGLREWTAQNIHASLNSQNTHPAVVIRRVSHVPGLGISLDIEMSLGLNGKEDRYRVLVEETLGGKRFVLSIAKESAGGESGTGPVTQAEYLKLDKVVWTKVGEMPLKP